MGSTPAGEIHIANEVLADVAGFAGLECYGIVGMANPSVRDGITQVLTRDRLRKGVRISTTDEGIVVHLHVVIEHGTNLAEVSKNLADRVRYVLVKTADVNIHAVEVHVQGIKVRK